MSVPRLLVTGAASGIGRAVVRLARAEGAVVAAADRDSASLQAAWAGDALCAEMDVTEPDSVEAGFAAATQEWGAPPTAVVNAAGIYRIAPTVGLDRGSWDEVMAINLTGALLVSQAAARTWSQTGMAGSIVLVSSIASRRGDRDEPAAHYAASKGAVEALCRQLAVEWGPLGVRVNAVAPGVIDTPMLRLGDDPARLAAYLNAGVPLGRLGHASEVAEVCWFLVGEKSSYVSGAVISVDGGAGAA